MNGMLDGVRVLDLSRGIAGPACTKFLADWGADVIKVERPGVGDTARAWPPFTGNQPGPDRSLVFLYLNGGKRSVELDLASPAAQEAFAKLVRWADIVVESSPPATAERLGLTYDRLAVINPAIVMLSISSFGQSGPYRDFAATEIVEYALSGLMYHIGLHDREPLVHGNPQAEYFAAMNAANGAVAALLHREFAGEGQHVDVSVTECLSLMLSANELSAYAYAGGIPRRTPSRPVGVNNIMECADGYFVPVAMGDWEMFAAFINAPELFEDRFLGVTQRHRQGQEVEEIVSAHVAQRDRHDLFHGAQALGLPFGIVQTTGELANCPQLESRDYWAQVEHPVAGTLRYPGVPFKPSLSRSSPPAPAPTLGQHNREVLDGMVGYWPADLAGEGTARSTPANDRKTGEGVLAGFRVIDSSAVWAMPLATAMLGDMGADVVKVESTGRPDTRGAEPFQGNDPTEEYFNRSGIFGTLNRGKRSVTLDFKSERGAEIFKQLVAESDVLIENNRPGVMKRLGLDYPVLSKINPRLIMLSNSGYGQTGPWSQYGAIALSLEPTTGVSSLTGYPGGPPVRWNWLTDYPTAMVAVFAVLGAIRTRERTGVGQWIDLCMYEVGVSTIGPEILDFTVNGQVPERRGNRHPVFAPQGCYRCAGEDRWVAISVRDDDEWQRLARVMERLDLASDERFVQVEGRRTHHDLLDDEIGSWTAGREARDVMEALQAEGVPAGAVQDVGDLFRDSQMHHRGFWQWVGSDATSPVGPKPYPTAGWRMSSTPMSIRGPAPTLGQHNEEVLGGLIGVPPDELQQLEEQGVIGHQPIQRGYVPSVMSEDEKIRDARWVGHDPRFAELLAETFASGGEDSVGNTERLDD